MHKCDQLLKRLWQKLHNTRAVPWSHDITTHLYRRVLFWFTHSRNVCNKTYVAYFFALCVLPHHCKLPANEIRHVAWNHPALSRTNVDKWPINYAKYIVKRNSISLFHYVVYDELNPFNFVLYGVKLFTY